MRPRTILVTLAALLFLASCGDDRDVRSQLCGTWIGPRSEQGQPRLVLKEDGSGVLEEPANPAFTFSWKAEERRRRIILSLSDLRGSLRKCVIEFESDQRFRLYKISTSGMPDELDTLPFTMFAQTGGSQ